MKLILTLLFLGFGVLQGFAQQDTTMIPFVAYWSTGDTYDFNITKIKRKWQNGKIQRDDSTAYLVHFEVLDSTKEGYSIQWKYTTNLEDFGVPVELYNRFSKYKMTKVIYTTNEVGQFLGIQNWQEIAAVIKELTVDLVKILEEENDPKNERLKALIPSMLSIYETRAGVEQLVLKELYYFHFPFGLKYSVTETAQYEEEFTNMFQGTTIHGDATLRVSEVDFEKQYGALLQEIELNGAEIKAAMLHIVELAQTDQPKVVEAMRASKVSSKDYNTYAYYYYPGVPVHIQTQRTTFVHVRPHLIKIMETIRIDLVE